MSNLFEGTVQTSPLSPRFHHTSSVFAYPMAGSTRIEGLTMSDSPGGDPPGGGLSPGGEEVESEGDDDVVAPTQQRRGRKRLWTPSRMSAEDRKAKEDFLKKYGTCTRAQDRVCADYLEFCRLNKCEPKFSLGECVGQWHAEKCYKPGTMDTYSKYIYDRFRSELNRIAHAACQKWNAANDVKHAPDYPFEVLWALVTKISDPLYRAFAFILLVSGLRPVALMKMMEKCVYIPTQKSNRWLIMAEIRLDKTSKKLSQRKTLKVPCEMLPLQRSSLRAELGLLGSRSESEAVPFASIHLTSLNNMMKVIATAMGLTNGMPTSYSFRRCYVYTALKFCDYDVDKTKLLTLHFSAQVLQAHYVTLVERVRAEEKNLPANELETS